MAKQGTTTKQYTDAYMKKCRVAWYAGGRPDKVPQIMELLPLDEFGRKPNHTLIPLWRDEQGWDIWADELDARVDLQIDDKLVGERVLMLQEQASRGRELQTKGMNYLRESNFDSSASAVNAIVQGAKMERTSRGISERLEKLLTMGDDDLTKEALRLLGQAKESGEVIDLEAENDEETDS